MTRERISNVETEYLRDVIGFLNAAPGFATARSKARAVRNGSKQDLPPAGQGPQVEV